MSTNIYLKLTMFCRTYATLREKILADFGGFLANLPYPRKFFPLRWVIHFISLIQAR